MAPTMLPFGMRTASRLIAAILALGVLTGCEKDVAVDIDGNGEVYSRRETLEDLRDVAEELIRRAPDADPIDDTAINRICHQKGYPTFRRMSFLDPPISPRSDAELRAAAVNCVSSPRHLAKLLLQIYYREIKVPDAPSTP